MAIPKIKKQDIADALKYIDEKFSSIQAMTTRILWKA